MLHTLFLIVAGLVLVGILSAEFEILGMQNHPYLARILAAICVTIAAYTHSWICLLIGVAALLLLLMIRRDWQRRAERKNQSALRLL